MVANQENRRCSIIHLRDSGGIYGTERVLLALGSHIDRDRFEMTLVCMRRKDGRSEELIETAKNAGIDVIPVDVNGKFDIRALVKIRRIVKQLDAGIVQSHDYKSDIYALFATAGTGVKRVVTAHGSTRDSIIKRLYLFLTERIVYRFSSAVVVVSNELYKQFCSVVDKERIHLIQNGIDLESFDRIDSQPLEDLADRVRDRVVFSIVGRLFPDKGHRFFFKAFAGIRKKHPGIAALVVGDGPGRESLEAEAREMGIEDSVVMAGFRKDMAAVYGLTDILVISSLREGLPYNLLEAMAAGIPVVATAVGDIPLLVKDGQTGYLIAPGKADELEKRMEELLLDPEKRNQLARRARALVEEGFSSRTMVNRTQDMYLSLVN